VTTRFDAKFLYRRLVSLFGAFDPSRPQQAVLESFLDEAFGTLREDLRLRTGVLLSERRDGFEFVRRIGEGSHSVPETVEASLPTLALAFRHGVYIFADDQDAGAPHQFGLLPAGAAAVVSVGRRPNRHVFLFALNDGWAREELDFALNTVRAALGTRLMEERVKGSFREAAEIQQSLLVDEPPPFPGFEIACRTLPAEEVGGDFFDFYPLSPEMLGLSIGDASGHGLPAALLVRDVVTGLRMGIERDLKIASVFEKLNGVIHRSALSSRFVSLFYGEIETNGNLIYVNAGHQPPLLFQKDSVQELRRGGTVIGPVAEARFQRGMAKLAPGGVIILCTDGIVERRGARGEFGIEGVQEVVSGSIDKPAGEILDRLFAAAAEYGKARPWEDDATAVVVKRLEA
jgi:sigma-B regulation protein RsbU (phosphoserine phosphatase)